MIIPMKKATLVVLKEEKEEILRSLQRSGEFMVIKPSDEVEAIKSNEQLEFEWEETNSNLKFIKQYSKKGFFDSGAEITYEDFKSDSIKGKELSEKVSGILQKLGNAETEIVFLQNECAQLEPWLTLDIPVQDLTETNQTVLKTGVVPFAAKETVVQSVENIGGSIDFFGDVNEGHAALMITYKDDYISLEESIKMAGWIDLSLPKVIGLPKDKHQENQKKITELNDKITEYTEEGKKISESIDQIEILNEQYKAELQRKSVQYNETIETIQLTGWVRSDRTGRIEKSIEKITDKFVLDFEDPNEDDIPPTHMENKKLWKPFEMITEMYSYPPVGSIDPTPVSAPWFWVIFGMMMGDVGYGATMAIGCLVMKKYKKPKGDFLRLINLMLYSSVTTLIFGVLFGSYFGAEWYRPILFNPMKEPVMMLLVSLGVGVLHIFSGMALKIAEDVRSGHVWDAIFDQVSWMLIISGAVMCFIQPIKQIGTIVAIVGALIVLCTAGRANKSILAKFGGGLYGLYNVSAYLSDILSYSRILALSLATAVIAFVMNLLAGMVSGSIIGFVLALLIYVVGHVFNLSISLLSAYVHDSRLQYIEFFNKFYEGGGIAFTPLTINTRSINIIDIEKED